MFKKIIAGNTCLICHSFDCKPFGWIDLFMPEKKEGVCQSCLKKLKRIEGETCLICGRSFLMLDPQFRNGDLCYDCIRWEEDPNYKGVLTQNFSLYLYNEFLKELIAKYKFRGDYVLSKVFTDAIRMKIKGIKPDHIIPIPLSEKRLLERGFNQAEALIVEANHEPSNILTRIHSEKQSKKTRKERIQLPQVFKAVKPVKGKVLLIDDIYTTGSTLRHAAKELKAAGANEIFSITIARG